MSARKSNSSRRGARKRILIVDDHPMTRYGIAEMLRREREFEVCGESGTAFQALEAAGKLKPDLVLADLSMPGKHGLEFVKDMHALHPDIPVLVVSMHDETLYAERVLKAGGRGYVMKHAGGAELLAAIRRVLGGHVYLSEAMASKALDRFSGRRVQRSESGIEHLTDREFQVFQCLGQGMTSREIAGQLHMGLKTVETHRRHVREKLRLRSGPELIKYAVRWAGSQQLS